MHEIKQGCLLLPVEMDLTVMEKRPEEEFWTLSFGEYRRSDVCRVTALRRNTCDPAMCSSEPAQY